MSEVNHNAASFNSESSSLDGDNCVEQQNQSNKEVEAQSPSEPVPNQTASQGEDSVQKMNWQKVAHKLREHNRRLYKQVFRLEQDLAEITNKFDKYLEKSKSSDLLMAHQAEEIKSYQENMALFSQQLASDRQEIDSKKVAIEQLSQQYELSQKQIAELERECTLLQEKHNNQAYDLIAKERENQELQTELEQQQQTILKYEAELKREREAEVSSKDRANRHKNYPHNRYIQPWSITTIAEPKISLPKTKLQPLKAKQIETKTTIKTPAEVVSYSTSAARKTDKSETTKTTSQSKKPQSLAAVDLPTFPRPR